MNYPHKKIAAKMIARIALGVLLSTFASASDSIRCGNQLVTLGDSRSVVTHKCGAPDDVTHSVVTERVTGYLYGQVRRAGAVETEVQTQTEAWLYNFGSNRFMSRLRFVDGRLRVIETLGYGFDRN
jgi:hypothetical protein